MSETELRELDARVHREVMGLECEWGYHSDRDNCSPEDQEWYYKSQDWFMLYNAVTPPGVFRRWNPVPRYSTEIAAAWSVVEKLKDHDPDADDCTEVMYVVESKRWFCSFKYGQGSYADSAPHAICLAALALAATGAPS